MTFAVDWALKTHSVSISIYCFNNDYYEDALEETCVLYCVALYIASIAATTSTAVPCFYDWAGSHHYESLRCALLT